MDAAQEDRIVLAAHNGHVQRWPGAIPGLPQTTPMGTRLADRLGTDYLVIATTSGTGQTLNTGADFHAGPLFTDMEPPEPGSLDALMAASHDGPFATDLRRLSPACPNAVRAASKQRAGIGAYYSDASPLDAYDVIVHLSRVTAAEPDPAALAHAPQDVALSQPLRACRQFSRQPLLMTEMELPCPRPPHSPCQRHALQRRGNLWVPARHAHRGP
jgi:erythromycin esterase